MNVARALLFDFDSTLLDNRGYGDVLWATCQELSESCPEVNPGALLTADTRIFRELFSQSQDQWALGRVSGTDLARETWRRALAEVGCSDNSVLELLISIHKRRSESFCKLFDDVRPFVETFHRHGIPLALITNSASDVQRPKIDTLNIGGWFKSIVISGEIGKVKPDPEVFEIALRELEIDRTGVWHIGDNLETDVAGANAAGIGSVWLNRFGQVREPASPVPGIEVESLTELASVLGPSR